MCIIGTEDMVNADVTALLSCPGPVWEVEILLSSQVSHLPLKGQEVDTVPTGEGRSPVGVATQLAIPLGLGTEIVCPGQDVVEPGITDMERRAGLRTGACIDDVSGADCALGQQEAVQEEVPLRH